MIREYAWAVVKDGRVVYWRSLVDGEEGSEIHRTRRREKNTATVVFLAHAVNV